MMVVLCVAADPGRSHWWNL